ncbi:MAG: 50S ribosomal protein L19 [Clostridia bacterium]|nr:50S ribosomal protein L19 [Clostridia bacterium]
MILPSQAEPWLLCHRQSGYSSGRFALYECLKFLRRFLPVNAAEALKSIAADSMKAQPLSFEIGDTVKVYVRIREGEKERIQMFEGTVIARRGSGVSETFTVRRVSYGVGVERVFPVNAPAVDRIEVVRHGKIRRSKLYYLRDRVGKAAKVKELIKK